MKNIWKSLNLNTEIKFLTIVCAMNAHVYTRAGSPVCLEYDCFFFFFIIIILV